MMRNLSSFFIVLLACHCVFGSLAAQTCDCPLKDGYFKTVLQKEFSFSTKCYFIESGAAVFSTQTDTVRSIQETKVVKVFDNQQWVLVITKSADSTVIAYSNLARSSVHEGDYLPAGSCVGLATKDSEREYRAQIIWAKGRTFFDPRDLLNCRNVEEFR